MPGTGKTTTIAYLISLLVARRKSVLLTSYTHSAIDNLLLKLEEIGLSFVRLGRHDSVHPSLRKYTVDFSAIATTAELTSTSAHRALFSLCNDLLLQAF
jgi:DNA replication ATP-dependent helicase Dna2